MVLTPFESQQLHKHVFKKNKEMSEIKTARLPSHQHLQYLQLVQELPPLSSPQRPETEKKTSFSRRKRHSQDHLKFIRVPNSH